MRLQSHEIHLTRLQTLQNSFPRPPQNPPKKHRILQPSKSSKIAPLWYENLIFEVRRAPKIVPKLDKKPSKNQLRLGSPLGTSKIRFWMLKSLQHGPPKIPKFFKNRRQVLTLRVFNPKCLLEASKSLPKASEEPPRSRSRALKRHQKAFKKPPCPLSILQTQRL